ncbi:hypothetical protein QF000_001478 [Paraburkholderia atlantica]|uniref:Phasin domain-containing protein n=2 Tax=Paraburkholderia atlantica TaxID=2654982 RepID=A0A7W8V8P2_PARAM|nr:hypothetical protein [Paraburkholderia atlantica]
MMDSIKPNSMFAEYTRMIGQFRLPGIDVAAILESRRKDFAAFVEANTTALAGAQSLALKQADMFRSTLSELQALVTRGAQSGDQPPPNAGEAVRQALHKAMVDMQQLADAAYRAQSDSVAVITKRVAERVEELKSLFVPKK